MASLWDDFVLGLEGLDSLLGFDFTEDTPADVYARQEAERLGTTVEELRERAEAVERNAGGASEITKQAAEKTGERL
ncbi:MAG: hypothetical protein LOD94_16805, partial [Gammaproteobacteria bacterium]